MDEIGELLGFLIIVFYSLAVLNFCFKFANRKFKGTLKKKESFYKIYMSILKILLKYHKYFGGATILMILLHFLVQYNQRGISITGIVAAGMMLLQIVLGMYGQFKKVKNKNWLIIHRGIAVVILITIVIHIL